MRPQFSVLLSCFALAALPSSLIGAENPFPYKAYVSADNVNVRSGPGQSYYATDALKEGQEVEVYKHEPGGWCAIRPPAGSFSWISSHHIKPTRDNLAVVTEENAAVRIGSKFRDVRDVIHVRLHKNEVVEVLEAPRGTGGGGANNWYKIAPPSGEFRWVNIKHLETEEMRAEARHRRGERPARNDSLAERSKRPRNFSPEEFKSELQQIDLELTTMVTEPVATWRLDVLQDQANVLLDRSQTALERGQARRLADKIARFDDLRQRQEAITALRERTDRTAQLYAGSRPRDDAGSRESRLEQDGRFDAVGRLIEVTPAKADAPRYAVVDSSGKIRSYITPIPGVPLRNYVGREIGVVGQRAYLTEQRADHVLARRIESIDGSSRLR